MIDKKTLEHIAKLARLHVTEAEAAEFSQQLNKAMGYFEQISTVNTEGVEALVTPIEVDPTWRDDQVKREFTPEEMTANAPDKIGNLFKVPPVV